MFGLRARRVAAPERARRLKRAVEILDIAHLLQRKPGQLSGGQQQRVALGRAIVAEVPVCLMDLTVPQPLDDAARLEGCSLLGRLTRVYVPLARPDLHPLWTGIGQLSLE